MERDFWPFRQSGESWDWDRAWAGRGPLGSQTGPPTLAIQSPTLGLQVSCKFPLAFGHLPASRNLGERSGPGGGQNLGAPGFIIHSKSIYWAPTVYSHTTGSNRHLSCPVLKLLGYQFPDPLWFLTTNPKYNTFSKGKSVKNDSSRCPCTFILIWFMFFVIEPIYEFGGVQAERMFLVMGPQWK